MKKSVLLALFLSVHAPAFAEPVEPVQAEPVCEPADEDIDKLFRVVAGNTADIMTLKQDVQALKSRSVSRPEQRIPNDFGKPYTGPQNHRPYTPPPKWEPNAPKRP